MQSARLKELVLFLTTGAISYCIYTAGFIGLRSYIPDIAAISLAYGVAWVFHFLMSTRVVFRHRVVRIGPALILRFATLYLLSYAMSVTVVLMAVKLGAAPVFATASGVAATTGFNYMMSRYWVFR